LQRSSAAPNDMTELIAGQILLPITDQQSPSRALTVYAVSASREELSDQHNDIQPQTS
jgi:hypothetical protein